MSHGNSKVGYESALIATPKASKFVGGSAEVTRSGDGNARLVIGRCAVLLVTKQSESVKDTPSILLGVFSSCCVVICYNTRLKSREIDSVCQ